MDLLTIADQLISGDGSKFTVIGLLLGAVGILWREVQKERAARIRDLKARNRWRETEDK